MKRFIRVNRKEYFDLVENFDERVEECASQLDMVRATFIKNFAKAKNTLDHVDDSKRSGAEACYYATLYSMIKNPKNIPCLPEDEIERLNVKSFEDYILVVQSWIINKKRMNSPKGRLIRAYSNFPKILLYPLFVLFLVFTLLHALNIVSIVSFGYAGLISNGLEVVIGAFNVLCSGKAIVVKYYK